MHPRGAVVPRLQVGTPRMLGTDEMVEGLQGDEPAIAISYDRHRPRGLHLAQQPGEIVAFRHRPLVFGATIPEQVTLPGTRPREDHRAGGGSVGMAGRQPPCQEQALRLGVGRIVAIAMDEDHQRPLRVVEQAGQVRSHPAAAGPIGNKSFHVECHVGWQAADIGQPPRADDPDVIVAAQCPLCCDGRVGRWRRLATRGAAAHQSDRCQGQKGVERSEKTQGRHQAHHGTPARAATRPIHRLFSTVARVFGHRIIFSGGESWRARGRWRGRADAIATAMPHRQGRCRGLLPAGKFFGEFVSPVRPCCGS